MKEQFVPYELAIELNKLGIKLTYIFNYYNTITREIKHNQEKRGLRHHIPAALWQQAFDWFMDKGFSSGIACYSEPFVKNMNGIVKPFEVSINNEKECLCLEGFDTYKEAQTFRLTELIKVYKEQQK